MMRYIFTAAAAAMLAATGQAHATDKVEETCGTLSRVAENIGELRYNDAPMRTVMEAVEGELAKSIVQDVYSLPAYSSDEYQQRAIRRYSNRVYRVCYEQISRG